MEEDYLIALRNSGAQQAARMICAIYGGKAGSPPELLNFLREV